MAVLAESEPVYLIANTNELDVQAIITLFRNHFAREFMNTDCLLLDKSNQPIEILPNLYLCVSYQMGHFKNNNTTPGLIESLPQQLSAPIKLISQYDGDLKKAASLGLECMDAEEFYEASLELAI